ncbi:MAG: SUMF1/EgtB/PvdO family nonheme iron enzyme [Kiritimatiellae bacterium]|nr:SUMF1/EgtB/PvdO family nonheme iron enzyme [Kiritimatiellia bacterium]
MRSYGGLWERIVSEENLRAAWKRVRRGHVRSPEVLAYGGAVEANLAGLREALLGGTWRPGAFRQFKIRDPKPRVISCAPVGDRVVHHALCGVVAPLLEKGFIARSFACREGKGAHRACRLAREEAKRHGWFLKMDVRRYFDSIPHGRLLDVLLPKFRESRVRDLVERIVRHPVPGLPEGFGLPIGNLTSQWFANAYLDGLDHLLAEGGGRSSPAAAARGDARPPAVPPLGAGYLRYMDDMLVFADSKAACWAVRDAASEWLVRERGLVLKDEATIVAPVTEGVPFLGLRIFPGAWRLRRSRFVRTRRKAAGRVAAFGAGRIGGGRLAQSLASADGAARWFGFKGILNNVAAGEGASSGSNRVKRGGSWNNDAANCRSANRNNNNPSNRNNNLGFRLSSIRPGKSPPPPTGSHPATPAPRDVGDEHARPRAASSGSERRGGGVFREMEEERKI